MPNKKILLGILIPVGVLILIVVGLLVWGFRIRKSFSARQNITVDLPQGIDYQNLNPSDQKKLLQDIKKRLPNKVVVPNREGQPVRIVQDVVLSQNQKALPAGLKPLSGDKILESTPAQTLPPSSQPQAAPEKTDVKGASRARQVQGRKIAASESGSEQEEEINWPALAYSYNVPEGQADKGAEYKEMVKIMELTKKYYPTLVKYYGEPFNVKNRFLMFVYDPAAEFSVFLPQYDTIILASSRPWEVIPAFVAAFQSNFYSVIPETWRDGMVYAVAQLAIRQFPEDWPRDPMMDLIVQGVEGSYEKYNVAAYPIWGAKTTYLNDFPDFVWKRPFLAAAAWLKIYQYDPEFFRRMNIELYGNSLDSEIWQDEMKVFLRTKNIFYPEIEKFTPDSWYNNQHVLHQTRTNPIVFLMWALFGSTFVAEDNGIHLYEFKSVNAGQGTRFEPRQDRSHTLQIYNDRVLLKTISRNTDARGQIDIPLAEAGTLSNGRYEVRYSEEIIPINYAYFMEKPYALYGSVDNFGEGKILAYDQNQNLLGEAQISAGAFRFERHFQGVIKLDVQDYLGDIPLHKELSKPEGSYYVALASHASSYEPEESGSRGAPPIGEGEATAPKSEDTSPALRNVVPPASQIEGLPNTFISDKYKFKISYPDDFDATDTTKLQGPNLTPDIPIKSEQAAQFMEKNKQIGAKEVGIIWHSNPDKTLKNFVEDYTSITATEAQYGALTIKGREAVTAKYKVTPGAPGNPAARLPEVEMKSYFINRGTDVFIFSCTSDKESQDLLNKMIQTFDFTQ